MFLLQDMATYIIREEVDIIRQPGNSASFQFTVDERLNLNSLKDKEIIFQIYRNKDKVFERRGNAWNIEHQELVCPVEPSHTKHLEGKYRWGIRLLHKDGVHDIGRGNILFTKKPLII